MSDVKKFKNTAEGWGREVTVCVWGVPGVGVCLSVFTTATRKRVRLDPPYCQNVSDWLTLKSCPTLTNQWSHLRRAVLIKLE